ncbi:MAG: hypothetical protein ABI347_11890 [Nitrososphaera sp.]|jgi:SOS response regulatory protein OraA/RecX
MAKKRRPSSKKDVSELEKLGVNRSLIEELSASEARELLRALRLVMKKYRDTQREAGPATSSAV